MPLLNSSLISHISSFCFDFSSFPSDLDPPWAVVLHSSPVRVFLDYSFSNVYYEWCGARVRRMPMEFSLSIGATVLFLLNLDGAYMVM